MVGRGELPAPVEIAAGIRRFDRAAIDKILDARLDSGGPYVDPDRALAEFE